MGLNSCLYECVIVHRRLRPKPYAFEHRMMMLYADLDELETVTRFEVADDGRGALPVGDGRRAPVAGGSDKAAITGAAPAEAGRKRGRLGHRFGRWLEG